MGDQATVANSDIGPLLTEIRDSIKEQNDVLVRLVDALTRKYEDEEEKEKEPEVQVAVYDGPKKAIGWDSDDDEGCLNGIYLDSETSSLHNQIFEHPVYGNRVVPFRTEEKPQTDLGWVPTKPLNTAAFDSIKLLGPQPQEGNFLEDWKYWIPAFKHGRKGPDQVCLIQSCGGRPDYIPPWELRLHDDGKLYHIDDCKKVCPLTPPERFGSEYHSVPYAFTPPAPVTLSGEPLLASTGINVEWDRLERSLGSLYSVPPDARLPLAFERNELRLKCASGEISQYLLTVGDLLDQLQLCGGRFAIRDFDRFRKYVTYRKAHNEIEPPTETLPYWTAARHALFADQTMTIAPKHRGAMIRNADFETMTPQQRFEGSALELYQKDSETVFRKPRMRGDVSAYEWTRIVSVRGIDRVVNMDIPGDFTKCDKRERAENVWSRLIYSRDERPRMRPTRGNVIREAFNAHLFCTRGLRAGNPFQTKWKPFHITWARVLRPSDTQWTDKSSWKSGKLYGTLKGEHIQETAFTLLFLPHLSPNHWDDRPRPRHLILEEKNYYATILVLAQALGEDERDDEDGMENHYMGVSATVLEIVFKGLRRASDSWEGIRQHFDSVLNDQSDDRNPLFEPAMHDALLFDDNQFSRSRRYFWAVDSLETFTVQIADTLREWKDFWAARETLFRAYDEAEKQQDGVDYDQISSDNETIDAVLSRIKDQLDRLEEHRRIFEELHQKTMALRDGLFNASAVIESRAATRLGENVKLLTYVSIFYLPLGFSAAIFSINKDYGITAFTITSVLVSIGTYILIANLENTVSFSKSVYRHLKRPVVLRMKDDKEERWAQTGRTFAGFQPHREETDPSEWNLLMFLAVEIWRKISLGRTSDGDRDGDRDGDVKMGDLEEVRGRDV